MNKLGWILFIFVGLVCVMLKYSGDAAFLQAKVDHDADITRQQLAIDNTYEAREKKAQQEDELIAREQDKTTEFETQLVSETAKRDELQAKYNKIDSDRQDAINAARNANDLANDLTKARAEVEELDRQATSLRGN